MKGFHRLKREGKKKRRVRGEGLGFSTQLVLFRCNILHALHSSIIRKEFRTFCIDMEFYCLEFRIERIKAKLYGTDILQLLRFHEKGGHGKKPGGVRTLRNPAP